MAAPRPPIDDFMTQRVGVVESPNIDLFMKKRKNNQRKEEIYRKGGIYEQFGPTPPVFNPIPKPMGGMVQAGAEQPGAALPFVGQVAGGYAIPVGGVAGALGGEVVRQGLGRAFGVQDKTGLRQLRQVGKNAGIGELTGVGLGAGTQQLGRILAPSAKGSGIRIARNIIRPTGRFAKRGERIAETALRENVLKSSAKGTMEASQSKINTLMDEVNAIANGMTDETITAEDGLRRMDALSRWYKRRGDTPSSERIKSLKSDIMNNLGLTEPVYAEKEVGQFVMGPASKEVTPQLTKTSSSDIRGPLKGLRGKARFDVTRNRSTGRMERVLPGRGQVITPLKYVENPEDIVALNIPKTGTTSQKIITASPKETFSIRPETKGISKTETVKVGDEFKPLSIREGLNINRGQGSLLKTKKVGGGFFSDTSSPEVLGRQEFMGGIRKSIANASPEIAKRNRTVSELIDVANVSKGREAVSSRNNLMDLMDSVMGTAAMFNPKVLGLLGTRKLYQYLKPNIAQGLYNLPKTAGRIARTASNPLARALISRIPELSQS